MKLVYRTIDGREFDTEIDAAYHESAVIKKAVHMFGWKGEKVQRTVDAVVVLLIGPEAAKIFLDIRRQQGDKGPIGIEEGYEGIFLYNEDTRSYGYIGFEAEDALYSAITTSRDFDKETVEEEGLVEEDV